MSPIAAWFKEGGQHLANAGRIFLASLRFILIWLVYPIKGARRCMIKGLELIRAFCSAGTIMAVIAAVEWALHNMHMLQIEREIAAKWTAILGGCAFSLHIVAQFFQQDRGGNNPYSSVVNYPYPQQPYPYGSNPSPYQYPSNTPPGPYDNQAPIFLPPAGGPTTPPGPYQTPGNQPSPQPYPDYKPPW